MQSISRATSFYDKVHNIHTQIIVSSITQISQALTGYFFTKDNAENTINYISKFENRWSSKENPFSKCTAFKGSTMLMKKRNSIQQSRFYNLLYWNCSITKADSRFWWKRTQNYIVCMKIIVIIVMETKFCYNSPSSDADFKLLLCNTRRCEFHSL